MRGATRLRKTWEAKWRIYYMPTSLFLHARSEMSRRLSHQTLEVIRTSLDRGSPFGNNQWQQRTAIHLGLELTRRPIGRPRKK